MSTTTLINCFPYFTKGPVVTGFGRGSKDLGVPTANFDEDVVSQLPTEINSGVYFGFANVDNGPVLKMVMSVGWNPYYHNEKKSMETHIMHKFEEDFYGKEMKIVVLGFIRPQLDFSSMDELIKTIKNDIDIANEKLESAAFSAYKNHEYFTK